MVSVRSVIDAVKREAGNKQLVKAVAFFAAAVIVSRKYGESFAI